MNLLCVWSCGIVHCLEDLDDGRQAVICVLKKCGSEVWWEGNDFVIGMVWMSLGCRMLLWGVAAVVMVLDAAGHSCSLVNAEAGQ